MKKLKIYLDTSTISHLQAEDVPEKMETTNKLWQEIKRGYFDVVLSELLFIEVDKCYEPKRSFMFEQLADIEYEEIVVTAEIRELANKYVLEGVFPLKYYDDAMHIACASVNGCNAVVSWNFKHMVKLKTILSVNGINKFMGYSEIEILTPESVIWEDD